MIKMGKGRPGGHPDIVQIAKTCATGPKTKEGKLRMLVGTGNLRPWSKSKVLNYFKKCDRCPLAPKIITVYVEGKEKKIHKPGRCGAYRKGEKCLVSQAEFIAKLSIYFKNGEKDDTLEVQKAVTYSLIEDAEMSREAEIFENRRPGHFTHLFKDCALKHLNELNKMTIGEKHRHEVTGDVSVRKKHDLSEEQLRRIADIMLERKKKTIEAEGKVIDVNEE